MIDHFLVQALDDAQLGNVPCTIHLQAGAEPPYYETNIEIDLSISLDQYGFDFPTSGMV